MAMDKRMYLQIKVNDKLVFKTGEPLELKTLLAVMTKKYADIMISTAASKLDSIQIQFTETPVLADEESWITDLKAAGEIPVMADDFIIDKDTGLTAGEYDDLMEDNDFKMMRQLILNPEQFSDIEGRSIRDAYELKYSDHKTYISYMTKSRGART